MKFIDLHCDTLMKLAVKDSVGNLYDNPNTSVSFKKMIEGNQTAQFFAIFLDKKEEFIKMGIDFTNDFEYVVERINYTKKNVEEHSEIIGLATNYDELKNNEKQNKISAFLTIEEGRPVDGSLENLEFFFNEGIRLISLTWNYENCFGYPNSFNGEIMDKGLKDFGKDAIQKMEELGMLVDVSHLSDGGFKDVADILKKPFVASHSNSRSITNHPRNLTDEMIKIMAEKGCVAGLNFCPVFLDSNVSNHSVSTTSDIFKANKFVYSRISDMIIHLNHMKNIGGEEFVALGSDLDGIGGELEISKAEEFQILFDELRKNGWKESQIEKLAYKNVERVIKDVLK